MKLASTSVRVNAWMQLKEQLFLFLVFSFASAKKKKKKMKLAIRFIRSHNLVTFSLMRSF